MKKGGQEVRVVNGEGKLHEDVLIPETTFL